MDSRIGQNLKNDQQNGVPPSILTTNRKDNLTRDAYLKKLKKKKKKKKQ